MRTTFLDDLYCVFAEDFDILKFWVEQENKFVSTVSVPGYGKEDLEVTIKDNYIYISGKDLKFKLFAPKELDLNTLVAECDKGVLKFSVDKKKGLERKVAIT
jgi:HSP20 family molecular chaperone IbpA